MQCRLTTSPTNRRLLLFFSGWGTDASVAEGMDFSGYDTAVVWDYRTLDIPPELDEAMGRYEEIVLAAWSFGVAAAARFISGHTGLPVTRRVAVNGTLWPVDDSRGIPEAIFRGTLDGLNDRTLSKFYRRMAAGRAFTPPSRPVDELASELRAIEALDVPRDMHWDMAFFSIDDRIIPAANQAKAWEGNPVRQIEGGHLPDFKALLAPLLIDKELVARRFCEASSTYDSASTVQRRIAANLMSIARKEPIDPSRTLEIGSGTGLLTRMILEEYSPRQLTLVDFNPQRPADMDTDNNVTVIDGDAELWIAGAPDAAFTFIASSSTMQWFNSPAKFLREVHRVLAPGGTALISTFGPATMRELEGISPRLPYLSAAELGMQRVMEENITLEFDSPAEGLRHMRLTGVNALPGGGAGSAIRAARHWPVNPRGKYQLTYNPIYLRIRK